jgi:hypothetical protein
VPSVTNVNLMHDCRLRIRVRAPELSSLSWERIGGIFTVVWDADGDVHLENRKTRGAEWGKRVVLKQGIVTNKAQQRH